MANKEEKVKYFKFVGSYGGAVKINKKWYSLNREYGIYALNQWVKETGQQLIRIYTPTWAYDHKKYSSLPVWLSKEEQKELSGNWIRNKI